LLSMFESHCPAKHLGWSVQQALPLLPEFLLALLANLVDNGASLLTHHTV